MTAPAIAQATEPVPNEAQQRFDTNYITAADIYRSHNVSRATLIRARRRGLLPNAIVVGSPGCGMHIWERTPQLETALAAWKVLLDINRQRHTNT